MKILIVDDLEVNLELLEAWLEEGGYEVVSAMNGVEALEILKTDSIDMIISDILMPRMDGYHLCRECKGDDTLRKIPFVFYTATYTDKKDEEFALSLGAERFIVKPEEHKRFMEIIEGVLKDHKKGLLTPSEIPVEKEEAVYLKEYNERLINKLEKKLFDLEKEITERKHAEEMLRRSEHYYRSLLYTLHEDILVIDPDYRITDVNNTFLVTLGIGREDAIGRHCFEVSHGHNESCNRHGEECLLRDVFETGEPRNCRHQHQHADGRKIWVDTLLSPLKDEKGKVTHVIEAMRDVTDVQKAVEALRESEHKYRTLLENLPQKIFSKDTDSVYVSCNENYARDLRIKPEEIKGKTDYEFFPTELAEKYIMDDKRINASGKTEDIEEKYIQDGQEIWVKTVKTPIKDAKGNITGILGVFWDITDVKKLEGQLQQAQKMEAIGTLAGGIAHDFNNILSAIIGYGELTIDDLFDGTDAKANLEEILRASKRARDLVKQILTFSRQMKEERVPLQIHLVVKEALKLLRSSVPATIEIRKNITASGRVMADPTQMHRVVMNLCTNAYHAMREEGGILEVNLSEVDLDSRFASQHPGLTFGPHIRLTVTDTGHGMDRSVMERIFDPYFTTKDKGEGTGLGLSVVHGIVNDYWGAITVYSEPGKGTTFHVYLPRVAEVEEKGQAESPLGGIPTGRERILFIDDNQALVDLGKRMLGRLGYEVVTRTSSIEALELFRAKPDEFDMVITDMTMPNMTGDKLAKEMMKIRPDIPVILCTGFSELISEERAKGLGIRAFVMKPVVKRDMAETVRRVLDE
jgi:PAS domain S-box-containing protein